MAEEAVTRTRTKPTGTSQAMADEVIDHAGMFAGYLHKFVAWRREHLHQVVQPGINRGGPAAVRAGQEEQVLAVLDTMATWLDAGAPGPGTILTEAEKEHWRWARDNGLPVADEIKGQL